MAQDLSPAPSVPPIKPTPSKKPTPAKKSGSSKLWNWQLITAVALSAVLLLSSGFLGYMYTKKKQGYDSALNDKTNLENEKAALEDLLEKAEALSSASDDELADQIDTLTESLTQADAKVLEYSAEIETLQGQLDVSEDDNDDLESQVASYRSKIDKIDKYNDFTAYMFDVLGVRLVTGTPATEAEYQSARTKAVATGDQDLITAVDYAWNSSAFTTAAEVIVIMGIVSDGVSAQT